MQPDSYTAAAAIERRLSGALGIAKGDSACFPLSCYVLFKKGKPAMLMAKKIPSVRACADPSAGKGDERNNVAYYGNRNHHGKTEMHR